MAEWQMWKAKTQTSVRIYIVWSEFVTIYEPECFNTTKLYVKDPAQSKRTECGFILAPIPTPFRPTPLNSIPQAL